MKIGGSTNYLSWNGSTLEVKGKVTATSGSFSGSVNASSGSITG
jgi:hypothetical protein